MTLRLVGADGELTFDLRPGLTLVLGRALSCDLPILDPTVSRKHAELVADTQAVLVRDLGSSNGTFVQGIRTTNARLTPGDRVVFGKVAFELREHTEFLIDDASAEVRRRAARAGTTIIRQVPVPDADEALEHALQATGVQRTIETDPRSSERLRDRQRLLLLVEISKALTRSSSIEGLLERMVEFSFRLLEVEFVSIWLHDETHTLRARSSRSLRPGDEEHAVSPALLKTVVEQQVAVLSDFEGPEREGRPTPRSAACAPLVAGGGRVLGVLYVDSARPSTHVTDEDLDFLVAFAGIGAVALDNLHNAERVRQQQRVRENFERFFTPHLASRIAAMPTTLGLGGERRTVAVLFADIRGFTPIAARLSPDETARLLADFFSEMVECVFRHAGTLDKFIGDAVMAQWGAPISTPDDADRALSAAMDMLEAVDGLNARWRLQGRPEIEIGIGLNFGDAFAGYTGSERRLEYTVLGDTVNTASRICAWAEGGEVLFTESLRAALTRPHQYTQREPLALRGKAEPVTVYSARR